MVRFKKAAIPECLISVCGRFTIKPASMVTSEATDAGFVMVDLKTGGRCWNGEIAELKREARQLVTDSLALHPTNRGSYVPLPV